MSLRSKMLAVLPPFRNLQTDIIQRQGTRDIITYILEDHIEYEGDYDKICEFFDDGTLRGTSSNLWNFLKYNFNYNAEPANDQTVKSPAAILQPGTGIDCKHYSLFTAGVLDALCRKYDDGWQWTYCFASDKDVNEATHVFVIANEGNDEIWIDPCLVMFDQRKKYLLKEYHKPMLSKISGTVNAGGKTIEVDDQIAWISFLTMVTHNIFGIRDILKKNMDVTTSQLKNYCLANNYDYDQLIRFLNS